jgi:enoyl-[acyl-carrier protein] reductase / trans-2-enoyl-CoA reductase (NAD+)
MPQEVIAPRIRGYICTNAHPAGCAAEVARQIAVARAARTADARGGNALIVGASTGYGLATRVAAAFSHGMATAGVFYERASSGGKTASAGWYNTAAFTDAAVEARLGTANVNGDAFSDAVKRETLQRLRAEMGPVDLFVYSLASPVRTHPETGQLIRSSLKPVGRPYVTKTMDLDKAVISEVTLEPASEDEIRNTVAVMGGDDLKRWMHALREAGMLAPAVRVVAYSYIGPQVTWAIYKDGTIGRAKKDVEAAVREIDAELRKSGPGRAWISVNSAVVTQASSAIPAVPLYLALLNRVLAQKGIKEDVIHEMVRLMNEQLAPGRTPATDSEDRIRVDDLEMRADVQAEISGLWKRVTTENVAQLGDVASVQNEFRRLFGFSVDGVDYSKPVEVEVGLERAGV